MSRRLLRASFFAIVGSSGLAFAQDMIPNWPAPELWNAPSRVAREDRPDVIGTEAIEAVPTSPLHFVGINPCRVADTRGNGFAGQYGPPALTPAGRNMVIAGQCGIPGDAQAVSFNFSAVNVTAAGFFVAYPAGGAFPAVATMTYNQNTPNLSNAAVVPLGTGGAITVVAAVTTVDLVVDINGYYRGGLVTAVNGLGGNVTLAAGSNVTITPSGQTLTVASTGGPGGVLPTGSSGQTLRHNGTSWIASSTLKNDGTEVSVSGPLNLANSGVLLKSEGFNLFHLCCNSNDMFLGVFAGNFTSAGSGNTGIGVGALGLLTGGSSNTGVGDNVLGSNTTGNNNTALGADALLRNAGGNSNTAIGYFALYNNMGGSGNTAVGNDALIGNTSSGNTAVGDSALSGNTTGTGNIAIGSGAGSTNTGGTANIYIGNNVGANTTGSFNLYIASAPAGNESNQIRIGRNDVHTQGTVIASIYGFGSTGGIPVIVNAGGRLGTTTSSIRYKDDVRDIGRESDGLMALRPVAFRYKPEHEPGGLRQYGLIAEEVAEVYPELVVYDEEGRAQAIRSQLLDPLLLNELQKQRRTIDEQRAELDAVKAKLEKLEALLEKRMD